MSDVAIICGICAHETHAPDVEAKRLFDSHLLIEHGRPPFYSPWQGLAVFSRDEERAYRYALGRQLGMLEEGSRRLLVVCLNPSTADERTNDPTVARLVRWAARHGYAELVVANIFAYRATDPKVMRAVGDPVGPLNDRWLSKLADDATDIVCAWGAHGSHLERGRRAHAILRGSKYKPRELYCFELTKDGHPRHPLYLRRDVQLRPYDRVPT